MRIANNITAINSHRLYTANNSKLSKSLEKLSSGYAINRAGDNAAGLAVSEKMRAQIAGLEQASKNAQDGISMVQTYEGALTETDSILQRMRSLAVQSANGTYDDEVDRVAINQEFRQLNDELNQIADTDFNGVIALNGGKMADGLKATMKADGKSGVFNYDNFTDLIKFDGATSVSGAKVETTTNTAEADKGTYTFYEDGDVIGTDKGGYKVTANGDGWYKDTAIETKLAATGTAASQLAAGTLPTTVNYTDKAGTAIADADAWKTAGAVSGDTITISDKVSQSNAFKKGAATLTYSEKVSLQVGARSKDLVEFTFAYDSEGIGDLEADLNCTAEGLGTANLSLADQESANAAIDKIDHAINKVSMVRSTFGAIQNRLEHKISNLDVNNENLTAAESRIRDTDMAKEMMNFTKNQILSQAAQSMLAQANQLPQGVLSLLQ